MKRYWYAYKTLTLEGKEDSNNPEQVGSCLIYERHCSVYSLVGMNTQCLFTNKIPNFLFLGCVQSYIQYLVLMYQYSSSHQQELIQQPNLV